MNIRLVTAELFHADRQTDMKLRVAFHNFAKAPKKYPKISPGSNYMAD